MDMQWIYLVASQGMPGQHQFYFCLWSLNALKSLIKRELKIELSKSIVSRLLKNLGLTAQRPVYKSYKQDPRNIKQYLEEPFPEAVKQAEDIGAS
jgi:transposase